MAAWSVGGRPGALVGVLERWWRPGALVGGLERWWEAWSVGGQPGALVGGLVIMLEPQDCPGTSGSDQERLDPTRSVWIRPGAFGSDQERLDPTRSVWIRPGASGSTGTRSGRQVGG